MCISRKKHPPIDLSEIVPRPVNNISSLTTDNNKENEKNLEDSNLIDLDNEWLNINSTNLMSNETKNIVSFYCTACGHANRMLTKDVN